MKKEHLFAVAIAAFAFFACSNDNNSSGTEGGNSSSTGGGDSSGKGGCLGKINGVNQTCAEENQYYNQQSCVTPYEWVASGCPSGGSICSQNLNGFTTVMHYYTTDLCGGSSPSSSSTPGSTPSSSSTPGSTPSSSSESGPSLGVCYIPFIYPEAYAECWENVTAADCNELYFYLYGDQGEYYTHNFQNSCPAGYEFRCEDEEGAVSFYGETIEGLTCEDMFEEY